MFQLILKREIGQSPRYCLFVTGLLDILDGLVTVCSLTLLSSSFAFNWVCWCNNYLIKHEDLEVINK